MHTTTGTRSEVRVGRECFPHERLCGDEFREVGSEDEAFAVAIPFLREIIRYAHRRCVQVWLVFGELPFVSHNLAPQSALVDHGVAPSESHSYQRYCGVAVPTGDPAALDIWEAALCAVIETYPEAVKTLRQESSIFFRGAPAGVFRHGRSKPQRDRGAHQPTYMIRDLWMATTPSTNSRPDSIEAMTFWLNRNSRWRSAFSSL